MSIKFWIKNFFRTWKTDYTEHYFLRGEEENMWLPYQPESSDDSGQYGMEL